MEQFLEIKCLKENEQNKILENIEKTISKKIKEGIFTYKEIRDIEEMRLHPLPDIQDVQSVYDELVFFEEDAKD